LEHFAPVKPEIPGSDLGGSSIAERVLVAQEAERRRFSREMHDDLAQKVALLEFQIEKLKRKLPPETGARADLDSLSGCVADLAEDLHRICYRLHPAVLENLGLIAGVEFLCDEYARVSGVKPKFIPGSIPEKVPSNVALCLYRVVQEALSNITKHASAQQVTVLLDSIRGGIRAVVRDNGRGFDLREVRPESSLGLVFICERLRLMNGRCSIRSAPGRGARIAAYVPLPSLGA
jgi:signal transduction histidine kinase